MQTARKPTKIGKKLGCLLHRPLFDSTKEKMESIVRDTSTIDRKISVNNFLVEK